MSTLNTPLQKLSPLYRILLLFVLLSVTAKILGALQTWQQVALWAMSLMFFFAGVGHFTKLRFQYAKMVPPMFKYPMNLIYITGAIEIAGAVALQVEAYQQLSAVAMMLFLVAVFPANYYAAKSGKHFAGAPHTPVGERALLQIAFIAALYYGAFM